MSLWRYSLPGQCIHKQEQTGKQRKCYLSPCCSCWENTNWTKQLKENRPIVWSHKVNPTCCRSTVLALHCGSIPERDACISAEKIACTKEHIKPSICYANMLHIARLKKYDVSMTYHCSLLSWFGVSFATFNPLWKELHKSLSVVLHSSKVSLGLKEKALHPWEHLLVALL